MKIIVENERERRLVESMCDVALRAGGIKNWKEVNIIIDAIELIKPKDGDKAGKDEQ